MGVSPVGAALSGCAPSRLIGAVSALDGLSSLTRVLAADAAQRGPRGFAPSLPQSGFHPASSACTALRLRAAGSLRSRFSPSSPTAHAAPGSSEALLRGNEGKER